MKHELNHTDDNLVSNVETLDGRLNVLKAAVKADWEHNDKVNNALLLDLVDYSDYVDEELDAIDEKFIDLARAARADDDVIVANVEALTDSRDRHVDLFAAILDELDRLNRLIANLQKKEVEVISDSEDCEDW